MRVGVVGPVCPDYFADNVGDALDRIGHVATQLGPARPGSAPEDSSPASACRVWTSGHSAASARRRLLWPARWRSTSTRI